MDNPVTNSANLLLSILELSRTMRARALESDWESVHEKEARRLSLIRQCFPLDLSAIDHEQAADFLREIMELDRSVLSLAFLAREELELSFSQFKRGRQASGVYASVESAG